MKTRKWTTEQKVAVVLEGLRGQKSVSEICRTHQIVQSQYYKWRDRFLDGGSKNLASPADGGPKQPQVEVERLEKIIGRQAIEIDALKKIQDLYGRN